jgi:hypothetical protein
MSSLFCANFHLPVCTYAAAFRWKFALPVNNIVTYLGFVWLIRQVLDLMIAFIGPLYNWLQQFTNRYLTQCHHLWLDTYTSLLHCIPLYSFISDMNYDWLNSHLWLAPFWSGLWLHSQLSFLLYSISVSMETPVEHRHPWKRNLGFQESVSMETYSSTHSLAMGLHVKICFAEL